MNLNCKFHKEEKIIYLALPTSEQLQSKHNSYLRCARCITEGNILNCRSLILISDIQSKSHQDYFTNWPILQDELNDMTAHPMRNSLHSIFNNFIQQQSQNKKNIIKDFFVQIKETITKIIDSIEGKFIQNEILLIENIEEIKSKYRNINNIDQLKNLLDNISQFSKDDNGDDQVNKILNEFFQVQHERDVTQELAFLVNKLERRLSFNIENNLERIKKSVLLQLKEIERQIECSMNECQNGGQEISRNEINVSEVMKLISNKSNFCSEQFLSDIETHLRQHQMTIFNDIDLIKYRLSNQYDPISFNHFNQEQLIQFKQFLNIQSHQMNNIAKNQIEDTPSNSAAFLIKLKQTFSPKTYQQLKEIFYYFPVLDVFDAITLEDKIDFSLISLNDLNEINKLIQQFEDAKSSENIMNQFTFTESCNYKGLKISYLDSTISFNQNSRMLQKCWSSQILDNNQVYLLKFRIKQMQRQGNGHILVGIIPDELKDKQMHEQTLQKTFVWNNDNGCKDYFKGINFYEIKGQNTLFSIYFSIKNKLFLVCDSLYTSFNYNKDAKYFDEKSYRIGISINNGFRDQTLELLSFKKLYL